MKVSRRRFLAISAGAYLVGGSARAMHRERFVALGAEVQITLPGEAGLAARAFATCRREVRALEATFSLWRTDSVLSRLNSEGRVVQPGSMFIELAQHATEMFELSLGGFDPTVQGLWSCLLYTSPSPRDKRQSRMPSSA